MNNCACPASAFSCIAVLTAWLQLFGRSNFGGATRRIASTKCVQYGKLKHSKGICLQFHAWIASRSTWCRFTLTPVLFLHTFGHVSPTEPWSTTIQQTSAVNSEHEACQRSEDVHDAAPHGSGPYASCSGSRSEAASTCVQTVPSQAPRPAPPQGSLRAGCWNSRMYA